MGHLLFVADFLPTVSLQLSLWSVWPDISLAPSHFMYWQCWQGPGLNNLAISYKALNTQWRHSTIARCWEWTFLLIPTSHNTDGGSSIVSPIHVPRTHEQGSIAVLLIYWACSTRAALSSQLSPLHSVQTVQWLWLYCHVISQQFWDLSPFLHWHYQHSTLYLLRLNGKHPPECVLYIHGKSRTDRIM